MTSDSTSISQILQKATKLEKLGGYSEAYKLLQQVWDQHINPTQSNKMPEAIYSEFLLRIGAITGYLGSMNVCPNSQNNSIFLLSEARNQFIKHNKIEKIAECELLIASAYYRKGEYKESSEWVEMSLSPKLDSNNRTKLHAQIVKSTVLFAETKFDEVISLLDSLRFDFENTSYLLKGCFATNFSLAQKYVGNLNKALVGLNMARYYHQKSRHLPYLATVENNIALLYKLKSEFAKALKSVDNAIYVFKELGDRSRVAFSLDTKAQIFTALGDFDEAERLANKAIKMMKFGDNLGMLSEIHLTKELAHFAKGNVKKLSPQAQKFNGEENLQLDLPPEILPNREFFGIRIKNADFATLGLKVGYLALVAKTEVKKGDLAAVSDNATDLVSIGFYENDFGLICLENYSSEPELLSENEVTIMGKIVGFCEPTPNSDGRYVVKPVLLSGNISDNGSENLMD